jgi:hypothetical protein
LTKFRRALEDQKVWDLEEKNHSLKDFAAVLHHRQHYGAICMNVTLAVLHLRALFEGSITEGIPDIPDDTEGVMTKYGVSNGVAFWNGRTPAKLRNPLQASALITPIILLFTNRMDNQSIKREWLNVVSRSYQRCRFSTPSFKPFSRPL